jgi:hypothetical protein
MRSTGLLLAACVAVLLLYGRPSTSADVPSTVASSPSTQSISRSETRVLKLQRYRLASELLDTEQRKLHELADQKDEHTVALVNALMRERLNKRLQLTFDRMHDQRLYDVWLNDAVRSLTPEKLAALRDEASADAQVVVKSNEQYASALDDQTSEAFKAFMRRFQELPWSKEIQLEKELVRVLTRERDEARAALMRD